MVLPISDPFKTTFDARLLNAINDVQKFQFPLLPVHVLVDRIDGKIFSTTDLTTAYHQVALTTETQKLLHFFCWK